MQYILTIPELCAELDTGGGVACGDDFVVFTRAQIPDWYLTELGSPELQDELTKAALEVELVVNFYMSRSDLGGQGLRSLPTLQCESSDQLDQKPWFFLNAAKVDPRGIGIAGRGNMIGGTLVETLLAVLSRPWCVLELCYSNTRAVDALLNFARLACRLDPHAYASAKILLSHERRHRLSSDMKIGDTPALRALLDPLPVSRKGATTEEIRALCAALFIASENSYSGFWMRGICVCALKLDLGISIFGSSLSDSTKVYTEVMKSKNLLHWAVDRQFDVSWAQANSQRELDFEESARAEGLSQYISRIAAVFGLQTLPSLYDKVLHEIMDLVS